MKSFEFFDVKTRSMVEVPMESLQKVKYVRTTKEGFEMVRYAVRAEFNGRPLTKFVSKDFWESLDAPEIE